MSYSWLPPHERARIDQIEACIRDICIEEHIDLDDRQTRRAIRIVLYFMCRISARDQVIIAFDELTKGDRPRLTNQG